MSEKRLTGDKLVLADAAKLEKRLHHRSKRVAALALFLVVALGFGAYHLYYVLL
jgi:hypothetical protein